MKALLFSVLLVLAGTRLLAADPLKPVAKAANGNDIPHPASTQTTPVTDGGKTIAVPDGMVYVPAGEFTAGTGNSAKKVNLDGYCIGKFSVTNAEYKAFLDDTGTRGTPSYWHGGTYPEGKANHPVAYVSLAKAKEYAAWVGKKTGWKVAIPTADQWEKAARGPKGFLYPWGNSSDVVYADGKLTSKFNFNGVTVAKYLKDEPKKAVTYNNNKSKYFGIKTTVDQIAGYDNSGRATTLSIGANGSVRGWVSHGTYTGFIYTDLFTSLGETGGNTTPVGSYEAGKSGYGCYDMAGNLWNWCDSTIVATNGAEKGKTVNEIRGGSWYAVSNSCRSTSIGEGRAASGAYNTVGFRIVMIPAAN
ncbi:formylglycine-generating enzyme family protein [Limnoglobus roseus]|uniref:Formylglycine-generating enzyme family protein n=1 Tax=Limnoglobus roseus TaxID=2598579 RepID=A0A5C1A9K8_9BACT|nr:SUMF1/EgtB/PvdO family nonheme iron enzyme [Limnoglobus roseus]QEL13738.1 formylglycine-generating enzyme family protein [Limnoglobus roseus]